MLGSHRKSSIDRAIGTSPRVGGLRGSSATGRGWWTAEKKDVRGYPKVRGGKAAVAIVWPWKPEPEGKVDGNGRSRGLLVISVKRGDISSDSQSKLGW